VSGSVQVVFELLPHTVPPASKQLSLASLQLSAQSGPPAHGLPAPAQTPEALHESVIVQNSVSLHPVPSAAWLAWQT